MSHTSANAHKLIHGTAAVSRVTEPRDGSREATTPRGRSRAPRRFDVTIITRFELLAGARYDRQRRLIAEPLSALPCLPLDEAAADRAAAVRQTLVAHGIDIGTGDSLIAGIVLAHRGILLTRNRRHFERVPERSLGTI